MLSKLVIIIVVSDP